MRTLVGAALIALVLTQPAVVVQGEEQFRPNGLVVLMTDYGTDSIYMGIIKGAIYSKFMGARIDSITNDVPPFDIVAGAYLLVEAAGEYPKGTVFVTIVDPGVGTERKSIVVESKNGYCFVGPDNGLMTLAAEKFGIKQVRELTNKQLWRAETTSTVFHGRDIYGPVGASLASGVPVEEAGPALQTITKLDLKRSAVANGAASGTVMRTDPYGNIVSNITSADLQSLGIALGDSVNVSLGASQWTAPFKRTYAEVPEGERLVVVQSSGFVEFAINKGSLADAIKEGFGAKVTVSKAK
ncbi:MAG: SAM-dependent chlorinase/fluorinase [Candidatus Hydrogenedentes bacterium]|nr:SAM-dependent chlorinase/fluorinase [Candidatus Hydrogenedentota bacterium]